MTASGLNSTSGSGSSIRQKLINGGTAPQSVVYTITASANGCLSQTTDVTVTVNPKPVATATPLSSVQCTGATTSIALGSNISGTTFTWTSAPVTDISGNADGLRFFNFSNINK